ncbi:hypothetical protein [Streptomyces sp. E-08]
MTDQVRAEFDGSGLRRLKDSLVLSGEDVVLQWDGPDTMAYTIQGRTA